MKTIIRNLPRLLILTVIVHGFAFTESSFAFTSTATQKVSTRIHGMPFRGSSDPIVAVPVETFSSKLSFNKFDPSLGTLQSVHIQFASIVDRYQYTVSVCGLVEDCFVNWIENILFVQNAYFSIHTPHMASVRHLDVPDETGTDQIGFRIDCNLQRSCSYTKEGTRGFPLPDPVSVTSQSILMNDFTGPGTIDIDFIIELFNRADGVCEDTDSGFLAHYSCRDIAGSGSYTSFDWDGEATITYVFEAASAGGFDCPGPVADAGGPYSGTTGSPITFDASFSYGFGPCFDISVEIVEYQWDFDGNGTIDSITSTPFATHTYNSPFTGEALLIVKDTLGKFDSDTAPVQVIPQSIQGDFEGDGDVDLDDLNILLQDIGKTVGDSACGSSCDLDGDGVITALDSRVLVTLCTRPGCAR